MAVAYFSTTEGLHRYHIFSTFSLASRNVGNWWRRKASFDQHRLFEFPPDSLSNIAQHIRGCWARRSVFVCKRSIYLLVFNFAWQAHLVQVFRLPEIITLVTFRSRSLLLPHSEFCLSSAGSWVGIFLKLLYWCERGVPYFRILLWNINLLKQSRPQSTQAQLKGPPIPHPDGNRQNILRKCVIKCKP